MCDVGRFQILVLLELDCCVIGISPLHRGIGRGSFQLGEVHLMRLVRASLFLVQCKVEVIRRFSIYGVAHRIRGLLDDSSVVLVD